VRRSGWFVAGMATAVGALAAGEMARRRVRSAVDELPPAVGYDEAMAPVPSAPPAVEDPRVEAEPEPESPYVTVTPLRTPPPDRRSDELRVQIAESRRRLHEKARAGAGEQSDAAGDAGGEDEDPTEEH
jgi:hypothetical protein